MSNVRELALSILNKCDSAGQYSNLALDTAIKRNAMSDADRGLLTALVYGTLEKRLTLDYTLSRLCDRPIGQLELAVHNLLRLGLYQLAFLDRVPDHAAVNETVAASPKKAKGLVNAVLRAFLRDGKRLTYPDPQDDTVAYLSVRYSFAPAICERFLAIFGRERAESLLSAFCKTPPLTLRTNTLLCSRKELIGRIREAGAEAEATEESSTGILVSGMPVTALPGFDEGLFFVQDEASQLCIGALDAHAGMRVLDVCACPGSKTFGIAIDMQNTGEVIACDLHANKLSLVESSAARLGLSNISTRARDARAFEAVWENAFDRVLCDVPCSGLGVFAKKPELRYKDLEMSDRLPQIQRAILETASRYVKAGGRLVYSTCTLLPEENGENVRAFLSAHPDFSLLCERTLFPDTDGTDGFFFSVLQKDS